MISLFKRKEDKYRSLPPFIEVNNKTGDDLFSVTYRKKGKMALYMKIMSRKDIRKLSSKLKIPISNTD